MASEIDMTDTYSFEDSKEDYQHQLWFQDSYCKMEGSPFPESDISVGTPSHFSDPHTNEGGQDILTLELQILQHPNLDAHLNTVRLYIKLDLVLLESISYLRQEGLWNTNMQQMYSGSVPRPQGEHLAELAILHPSLYQSPPPSLFNLICEYRRILGSNSSETVEKFLRLLRPSILEKDRKGSPSRKVAPQGRVFACPSAHCRKMFKKAGHARNHVQSRHPEYLQLNPEYHPETHMTVIDLTGLPD